MITPSLLPSRGLVFRTRLDGHTISNVNGVPTNATGASLTYATSQYGIQSQYGVFNGSSNYVDTSTLADSNTYDIYVRFRTASFATNQFLFFEGDTSGGADMSLQITWGILRWTTKDNSKLDWTITGLTVNTDYIVRLVATTASGGLKQIWIGDSMVASATGCTNVNTGNHFRLQIGRFFDWWTLSTYLNGRVGMLSIHNVILTDQERQAYLRDFYRNVTSMSYTSVGFVNYWDFKGDANDIISGKNLTITGTPTLVTDRLGLWNKGYQFASWQYARIAWDACGWVADRAFSVVQWIRVDTVATLKYWYNFANTGGSQFRFSWVNNTIGYGQEKSTTWGQPSTTFTATAGQTYCVAVSTDVGVARLLIDWVFVATGTNAGTGSGWANAFSIGSVSDGSGANWGLTVYDTICFDKKLSDAEMIDIYNITKSQYILPY